MDFVGYDLNRIEGQDIASAQACQELCAIEPECAFFSYKISNKGCYLKSAAAPLGRTPDADVISGPEECSKVNLRPNGEGSKPGDGHTNGDTESGAEPIKPEEPTTKPEIPDKSCAAGGVEYRGHDVAVTRNARSAAYCQQLCASSTSCFFWTWDKNKQICYQKDEYAAEFRVSGRHTLGTVSGAKDCLPINPGKHFADGISSRLCS